MPSNPFLIPPAWHRPGFEARFRWACAKRGLDDATATRALEAVRVALDRSGLGDTNQDPARPVAGPTATLRAARETAPNAPEAVIASVPFPELAA